MPMPPPHIKGSSFIISGRRGSKHRRVVVFRGDHRATGYSRSTYNSQTSRKKRRKQKGRMDGGYYTIRERRLPPRLRGTRFFGGWRRLAGAVRDHERGE